VLPRASSFIDGRTRLISSRGGPASFCMHWSTSTFLAKFLRTAVAENWKKNLQPHSYDLTRHASNQSIDPVCMSEEAPEGMGNSDKKTPNFVCELAACSLAHAASEIPQRSIIRLKKETPSVLRTSSSSTQTQELHRIQPVDHQPWFFLFHMFRVLLVTRPLAQAEQEPLICVYIKK
jgi:hypothetical protein